MACRCGAQSPERIRDGGDRPVPRVVTQHGKAAVGQICWNSARQADTRRFDHSGRLHGSRKKRRSRNVLLSESAKTPAVRGGCGQRDVDNRIGPTDVSDCAADAQRASQQESES